VVIPERGRDHVYHSGSRDDRRPTTDDDRRRPTTTDDDREYKRAATVDRPVMRITGHRGAAELAPENTIAAFGTAIGHGVDAVEFDVRTTADDELVVVHDDSVDRTTDGTGRVDEMDLAELRMLDAGDGQSVPTLAEVLDFLADEDVDLRIEFKERGLGERVVDAVTDRGLEARTTITSFDHEALEEVAGGPPRVGFVAPEPTVEALEVVDRLGAAALFVNIDAVDASDVEEAASRGLELGVWTVNDPDDVDRAVSLGVDSITTDRPDMVARRVRG
jgi:glycerophosphoryl diester phosphodiesterase